MPELEQQGDVWILNLGDGENRFTSEWIATVSGLLEQVAARPAPRALVTTATGKFWSNGIDLDWLGQNPGQIESFVNELNDLYAQVLVAPLVTVAALQGHCFAGGAMLALAHDFRVMRADRGFFCLPEADIDIPFTPGMSALIQAKLTPAVATEAMVTARRYGGADAAMAGIVDAAVAEDQVVAAAVGRAAANAGKQGQTIATIKERMYATEVAVLRDREANKLGQ